MTLHRIQVKLFAEDPGDVVLEEVVPIFHRWIQQHALDGLLIDVVDYKHVHDGPGIVLIGHEADYGFERVQGRLGLRYTRKRGKDGPLDEVLTSALGQALRTARLLETDLESAVAFRTDEVEVVFLDGLRVPNEPASLDLVRPALETAFTRIYGDAAIALTQPEDDSRRPFTLHTRIPEADTLDVLIERLEQRMPATG